MAKLIKKSPAPLYLAAAVWILWAIFAPMYAWWHFVLAAVCSVAAWLLGPRYGALSVAAYLLLGGVGVPVFAGYAAGAAVLLGPTGGYLIGYLAQAMIGGWAVERAGGRMLWSALGLAAGVAVCYAFGTGWFIVQMGCTLPYALTVCVLPFIPFDLVKIGLASALGSLLRRSLTGAGLLPH